MVGFYILTTSREFFFQRRAKYILCCVRLVIIFVSNFLFAVICRKVKLQSIWLWIFLLWGRCFAQQKNEMSNCFDFLFHSSHNNNCVSMSWQPPLMVQFCVLSISLISQSNGQLSFQHQLSHLRNPTIWETPFSFYYEKYYNISLN